MVKLKRIASAFLAFCMVATCVFQGTNTCFAGKDACERSLADGVYEICAEIDSAKNLCVIPGGEDELCVYDEINGQNEKFFVKYNEVLKTYTLKSMYTGNFLGAKKAEDLASAKLRQYPYSGEYYQDWVIQKVGPTCRMALKIGPESCVNLRMNISAGEVKNGATLGFTIDELRAHAFNFSMEYSRLESGVYEITSPALFKDTYSVLDVSSVADSGAGLGPNRRNGYASQKFFVDYNASTRDYTISAFCPRLFLGAEAKSGEKPGLVCKNQGEVEEQFKWAIRRSEDGYYTVISKTTGLILEIDGEGAKLSERRETPGGKLIFSNIVGVKNSDCLISSGLNENRTIAANGAEPGAEAFFGAKREVLKNEQYFNLSYDKTDGCHVIRSKTGINCLGMRAANAQKGEHIALRPTSRKNEVKWIILKFRHEKGDFFAFVLKSSLVSSPVKSRFLAINAPGGDPKIGSFLDLNDASLDGELNSQAFKITPLPGVVSFEDEPVLEEPEAGLSGVQPKTAPPEPDNVLSEAEPSYEEEEEPEKREEFAIPEGLTADELGEINPEFQKYIPHIKTILENAENPDFSGDASILEEQGISPEIIITKLSYICNKINFSRDVRSMKPYPVQILAVLKLLESVLFSEPGGPKGAISDIKTGEGKSFVTTLTAIVLQSYGRMIDVVTPNMELVTRDWKDQKPYYDLFGISSGFLYDICNQKGFENPLNGHFRVDESSGCSYNLEVLNRAIVYSTGSDFQWLYLRGTLSNRALRTRDYDVCIIDEADNILLDTATSPALLPTNFSLENSNKILTFVYESVTEGREFAEIKAALEAKFRGRFSDETINTLMKAATIANEKMLGKHYILRDKQVVIIDENTGFVANSSRWNAYIHEMVEIKEIKRGEEIEISQTCVTNCAVCPVVFFGGYKNLIGVTGTSGGEREADLFERLYRVSVFKIPVNRPTNRDVVVRVYGPSENLDELIAREALEEQENGRPVLIILDSVRETNEMRARFLPMANLIQGLDAQRDKRAIEVAGNGGTITIATIAAGRGTDIKLDERALGAGGLHVIVAKLPALERTFVQNIGRSARQGQPGSATVYVQEGGGFGGTPGLKGDAVQLFALQKKFIEELTGNWPWMTSVPRRYCTGSSYNFGVTTDEILRKNAQIIVDKFFWPGKVLRENEYHECLNLALGMVLQAWGNLYSDLERTGRIQDEAYVAKMYDELLQNIYKWVPKDCRGPEEFLGRWARVLGKDEEIFRLLYTRGESETVPDFLTRLFRDFRVIHHARQAGVNLRELGSMVAFLPEPHRRAYAEYLRILGEYQAAIAQYQADLAAYNAREVEREAVDRENNREYTKEVRAEGPPQIVLQPPPAPPPLEEPKLPEICRQTAAFDPFGEFVNGAMDALLGSTTAHAAEREKDLSVEERDLRERRQAAWDRGFARGFADAELAEFDRVHEMVLEGQRRVRAEREEYERREAEMARLTAGFPQSGGPYGIQRPLPPSLRRPISPSQPDLRVIGRSFFRGWNVDNAIWGNYLPPSRRLYGNSPLFCDVRDPRSLQLGEMSNERLAELVEQIEGYNSEWRQRTREDQEHYQEVARKRIFKGASGGLNVINASSEVYAGYAAIGAAIALSAATGGVLAPLVLVTLGVASVMFGSANLQEGVRDIAAAIAAPEEALDQRSRNPLRDGLFGGNQGAYSFFEMGVSIGTSVATARMLTRNARRLPGAAAKSAKIAPEFTGKSFKGPRNLALDFTGKKGSTLAKHMAKHGKEFGYSSEQQYLQGARDFIKKHPTKTTQSFVSPEGTYFRYDIATNEFGIINQYGGISTYYKPDGGLAYWMEQIDKYAPK